MIAVSAVQHATKIYIHLRWILKFAISLRPVSLLFSETVWSLLSLPHAQLCFLVSEQTFDIVAFSFTDQVRFQNHLSTLPPFSPFLF